MKKFKAPFLLSLTLPVLLLSIPLHNYFDSQRSLTYSPAFIYLNAALYFVKAALFVVAAIEVTKAPKSLFTRIYTLVSALAALLLYIVFFLPTGPFGWLDSISVFLVSNLGYGGLVCVFAYFIVLFAYQLAEREETHGKTEK